MNPDTHRCGFVTIVGKPNAGKSTLMNALLGERLSIITPKPQTTRQNIKGILTQDDRQIIFIDTPGYLKPRYELQRKMLTYIESALGDSDLLLFLTDVNAFPTDYDLELIELVGRIRKPRIAVLNKIDIATPEALAEKRVILESKGFDKVLAISAREKQEIDTLLETIATYMPFSPPLYDGDGLSDLPTRFFVQEIIREQVFLQYTDEIPYSATVTVETYHDFPNKAEIAANIWLERDSQKGILIGNGGQALKQLRTASEKSIHALIGKRVKLMLWVKVKINWRDKKNALKEFGYR
jgi:GTP-binding protein Era